MTADSSPPKHIEVIIQEITLDQAEQIEPLWQKLNTLHHRNSVYFKDHFNNFTFPERLQQLNTRDHIAIFVASAGSKHVGYCLCSIFGDIGEIDSIYIDELQRKSGLGRQLVEKALQWFKINGLKQLTVSIAHGNEGVVPFYENFGFKPRYLVMTADLEK